MATDDTPTVSVAVGITVGLIASLVQSLGLTIQRKSHILNDELPERERKVEHRRPLWLLGFAIFISSNILGSIFQIAALPVVILAPLGAVSLLWNAFFARLLLGDVFSHYMVIGTLLIATGAVLIAVFGIVSEPTHSLDDLLRLFGRHIFIVYFSLLGFVVLCVLVVTHLAEYRLPTGVVSLPESATLTPVSESPQEQIFPTERTPLLLDNKLDGSPEANARIRKTRTLIAVSYASISGILSGMCLIFAKSGVELLMVTIGGQNQFWRWESWMLVGGLIVFALLQIWYLHKSLVLADPTLVCPLAFCFYNLSSILNGLVYYDQFAALSVTHLLLIILGIAVLLGGVWAVSVQAGGPGVEVGTWQEGAEVLTSEALNMPGAAVSPVVVPPTSQGPRLKWPSSVRRSRAYTDDPTRLGEVDEASPLHFQEPAQTLMHSPSPPSTSTSLTQPVSPPSPTRNRRASLRKWTGLLTVDHDGRGSLSGLSIGIGATSPGFAIVPTRRRRVSQDSTEIWRRASRRTVSESDVPGIGGLGIVSVHSLVEEGRARAQQAGREEGAPKPPPPIQRLVSAVWRVFGIRR